MKTGSDESRWSAVEDHFGQRADTWADRYFENPSFRARLRVVGAEVERELAARPDARVLDLGGGTGLFSLVSSGHASFALCLDPSQAMVRAGVAHQAASASKLAHEGFSIDPGRVRRVTGTADCLGERACGRFDVVLVVAVLEYVEDVRGMLESVARLLAPGGVVLVTVPRPRSWFRWVQRRTVPLLRRRRRQSSTRLEDQSFVSLRPYGDFVPWEQPARQLGLAPVRRTALPMATAGVLARIRPSELVVLKGR